SLRMMLHRVSEGGVSSPLLQRAKAEKQVEYLDLDLHTGRLTPSRQLKVEPAATSKVGQVMNEHEEIADVWTMLFNTKSSEDFHLYISATV
ncbi:hypothetical protein XENOCAPTIV_014652, partial [Xenoophorus captivus]